MDVKVLVVDYHRRVAAFVRTVVAGALALEVANAVLWASRLVSSASVYDVIVLGMIVLRIGVTTVQAAAAWMLVTRAPPAVLFARWALASSAVLLVLEIGARLSPSSLPPGTRWIVIAAYGAFATAASAALGKVDRADREPVA